MSGGLPGSQTINTAISFSEAPYSVGSTLDVSKRKAPNILETLHLFKGSSYQHIVPVLSKHNSTQPND